MTENNSVVSTDIINRIRAQIGETYYTDIKYNIRSKSRWKMMGDMTEALSYIMTGIATILAFSAGFSNNAWLSFAAGCFSTASLVFLNFSSYATKESKERTRQVNKILDKLGIDQIPDIAIDSTSNTTNNQEIEMTNEV